jgi:hypothetical protein
VFKVAGVEVEVRPTLWRTQILTSSPPSSSNSSFKRRLTSPGRSLSQGRIEKWNLLLHQMKRVMPHLRKRSRTKRARKKIGDLRNQVVSSLVWLWWDIDMLRFEFKSGTFRLFYLYLCFIWRIVFPCLVVCRWHVRYGGQWRGSRQE